ncbi:hypothetical protein RB195_002695 [Necator americanus]|uniref:Uncharacterized protein n=1 Tax=Necator americanus TaxID=51031 RepID=A0ABR1DN35_NECAM
MLPTFGKRARNCNGEVKKVDVRVCIPQTLTSTRSESADLPVGMKWNVVGKYCLRSKNVPDQHCRLPLGVRISPGIFNANTDPL